MKKLTKFISLALGALMMLGVGVGIKPMMEKASADAAYVEVSDSSLDLTDKKYGTSGYSGSLAYGDWTIVNGANNNKGWTYFKMGGKSVTLASANPCYIYSTKASSGVLTKYSVHCPAGSLSKAGMSVNSWGLYVYSDSARTTQLDYVVGGTITNAEGTFDFVPDSTGTYKDGWPKNSYYKVSWDLANTTTTNGIVFVDKITAYANASKVKIDFYSNDGTDGHETQEINKDESTALTSNTFARTGYDFAGWNTKADGTGTNYSDGQSVTLTQDLKLYAQWFLNSNYSLVIFHSNNGVDGTFEQIVPNNVSTALNYEGSFTNIGQKITKWNTTADGDGTDYALTENVTISAQLDLYAVWGNYTIAEIIANAQTSKEYRFSGEITGIVSTSSAYIQDATAAINIYSYAAITTNKSFKTGNYVTMTASYGEYNGYAQAKDLSNIVVEDSSDTTVDTLPLTNASDVTSANQGQYIKLNTLQINSKGSAGSTAASVKGQTFSLWYTTSTTGYSNIVNDAYLNIEGFVAFKNSTALIHLSKVTTCEQYTITYVSNGGTSVDSETVLEGNKFTKPADPTRKSDDDYTYSFDAWYTDDETFLEEFDFDAVPNKNVTVYAYWNKTARTPHEVFESKSTVANLSFKYNKSTSYGEVLSDEMNYPACATTTTMGIGNNASIVNLDSDVFNVKATKSGGNNYPGLNKSGYIALYYHADGCSTIEITCNTGIITTISASLVSGYANLGVTSNGKTITGTDNSYNINYKSFTLTNANTSSAQVRISSLTINYKEGTDSFSFTQTEGKNNLKMQFAGRITPAFKDSLDAQGTVVSYGMIYCKASALGTEEHISDVASWLNDSTYSVSELQELGIYCKPCTPAAVDSTGFADGSDYIQWGVSINNISNSNVDTVIKASAYVCIDGVYYVMNEKAYSAKTLAQDYLTNHSKEPAVIEHKNALTWLAGGAL